MLPATALDPGTTGEVVFISTITQWGQSNRTSARGVSFRRDRRCCGRTSSISPGKDVFTRALLLLPGGVHHEGEPDAAGAVCGDCRSAGSFEQSGNIKPNEQLYPTGLIVGSRVAGLILYLYLPRPAGAEERPDVVRYKTISRYSIAMRRSRMQLG